MQNITIIKNLDQLATHAQYIAQHVKIGDVVTLQGDLGVGKTEWVRAFIRAHVGQDQQVPSPTFSLVQHYQGKSVSIWHFDLYRLKKSHDVWELGLEEALAEGVSLIEWPERLGQLQFGQHLALHFELETATEYRIITVKPDKTWQNRFATNLS